MSTKECPLCHFQGPACGSTTSDEDRTFYCTLKQGHDGEHIACGTFDHDVKRWPRIIQEPEKDETQQPKIER